MKKKKIPKILIISNNALSETNNNGKTISYFFEGYPKNKLRQLYFNSELPTGEPLDSYFQITDKDVLDLFLRKKESIGQVQQATHSMKNSYIQTGSIIPVNETTRLVREFIWKNRWDTEVLWQWLDEFNPEIVFFVAGDSGFAYDITRKIQGKYKADLITYITDDYILPRSTLNIFWWIRRYYILGKMRETINKSVFLVTISEKMRKVYKKTFGKDSFTFMNLTDSYIAQKSDKQKRKYVKLIYAGSLHFNRYLVLEQLGKALEKINKEITNNQPKYRLEIYTNTKPSDKILGKINVGTASIYKGNLSQKELMIQLNKSDIPVHVESFDRKSIESTRLSLSTKILEYLSLEKPVLAIGPKKVASMEFLSDKAYCINDQNNIQEEVYSLLSDKELQNYLSKASRINYEKIRNHRLIMLDLLSKFK